MALHKLYTQKNQFVILLFMVCQIRSKAPLDAFYPRFVAQTLNFYFIFLINSASAHFLRGIIQELTKNFWLQFEDKERS